MTSTSPETTLDSQHLHYLTGANEVSFEGNVGDNSKHDQWYRQMESFEQCTFDQDFKTDEEHRSTRSDQFGQHQETYSESNSTSPDLLDPPKPPRTAMMCFSLSKAHDQDESKVDIASLAEEYASLSKDEKLHWEEESRKDKDRYRLEMDQRAGEYKMPKRRAKKHPLAPKRPMSAFLKYSKDKRKEVKMANPDLNNTDISRLLGQMWNEASDQEKEPYITEELTARATYKCAIAKFRVSQRNQEMEMIRNAAETRKVQVISATQTWDGVTPSRSNTHHHSVRKVTPVDSSEGHGSFVNDDMHYHHSMPPLPSIDRNHGHDISERDTSSLSHPETRQVYTQNYDQDFRYDYPLPSQHPYPERYDRQYHHGYHTNGGHLHNYHTPSPHHAYGNSYGYHYADYYSQNQPHHKEHRGFEAVPDHLSLSPKRNAGSKSEVTYNGYEHEYSQYSDNRHNDYYYSHVPTYKQDYNPPHWDPKENPHAYHTHTQDGNEHINQDF